MVRSESQPPSLHSAKKIPVILSALKPKEGPDSMTGPGEGGED